MNKNNLGAKKKYGQCFLIDNNIISKIVSSVDDTIYKTCIEIGPGRGALTLRLKEKMDKIIAYEIDKDCIDVLKSKDSLNKIDIINIDFLKADLTYLKDYKDAICVSNIPYYITSPIISRFLNDMDSIKEAVFMVQKEVGDRLLASPKTKDYNAFTITVQYLTKVERIVNVKRTSFNPSPNVDSVVIKLTKIDRINKANDDKLFISVVETSFKERRKTLVNNLNGFKGLTKDDITYILSDMEKLDTIRAEELSIDEFIILTNMIEGMLCQK